MHSPSFVDHKGCRLSYTARGSGPAVLFIQGVAVPGDGWLPQADAFSDRYRCITFDNRGIGGSLPVGAALTLEQMAEDADLILDREGVQDVHVVGHSMGGLIALALALNTRKTVRSLSLLCTFPTGKVAAPPTRRMLWLGLRSRIGTRRARRRAFLELIMPASALVTGDPEELARRFAPFFGRDLADHPSIEFKQLGAMRRYDARPRLHELSHVPTLVVAAEEDPIAPPAVGRALAAAIPGARYVELSNASHGVPVHEPGRINELLDAHFSTR